MGEQNEQHRLDFDTGLASRIIFNMVIGSALHKKWKIPLFICAAIIIAAPFYALYKSNDDSGPVSVNLAARLKVDRVSLGFLPEAFVAGKHAQLRVTIVNDGPAIAQDVGWTANVILAPEPFGESNENAFYEDFRKRKHDIATSDYQVSHPQFKEFASSRLLSESDISDLKDGRMRLYLVGYIEYRDTHGPHEFQFCDWLHMPPSSGVWHSCVAPHNRYIK